MQPTVKIDCCGTITINEGDDITCLCKGEGGNPPATVSWFKDDVQVGERGKEEQVLTLSNVDKSASGRYKCVAKSYNLTDETSLKVIVHVNRKYCYVFEFDVRQLQVKSCKTQIISIQLCI